MNVKRVNTMKYDNNSIFNKILNIFSTGFFFTTLFFVTILINCNLSFACEPLDARFSLVIGNVNIDFDRLREICTEATCKFVDSDVVLKSSFDNRVAIIISRGDKYNFIKNTIVIKLPYETVEYEIKESSINPETFDWKNCVKKDLKMLRDAGIIKLNDFDIEVISNYAQNHKNILLCEGLWKKLEANCNCEACVKCLGAAAPITLPEKSLSLQSKGNNEETKFLFFIIALVIILSLIVSILLFFSRITSYE